MNRVKIRNLSLMAILVAMEIILSRFLAINAWNVKIGFNFVPLLIAASLLGPLQAAVVAALGDFLGAVLFPIGAYFPGFTLTAFLTGLVFGFFLHGKDRWGNILGAVLVHQALSLGLNTLWISILYASPYMPLLYTRLFQCALMLAVELATTPLVLRAAKRLVKHSPA